MLLTNYNHNRHKNSLIIVTSHNIVELFIENDVTQHCPVVY